MVDQVTAEEFADRLDADESFTIVDTRGEESFEAWHLPGAANVPYDPREGAGDDQVGAVEAAAGDGPVVTVCGKGLTSAAFAFELDQRGFEEIEVLRGGMEAWSTVHEVVPVETDGDLAITQVQRRGKGCLGYVVGAGGEAVVVDPTRRTDIFEVAAERAGLTICGVVDTHVHADHLSGGRDLAATLDVPYYLGAEADVEFEFEPLADGDVVEVGDREIEALHAPGHTAEMVNLLVDGEYLLSADTLFVESVGRTELQFGEADAERGARLLYETLQGTILELPDDVTVLPGHVTVTADNRFEVGSPGDPVSARLGDLREDLALLGLDEDAFVDRLTGDAPEKPPNYEAVVAINRGERTVESDAEATELEVGPNNCAA